MVYSIVHKIVYIIGVRRSLFLGVALMELMEDLGKVHTNPVAC